MSYLHCGWRGHKLGDDNVLINEMLLLFAISLSKMDVRSTFLLSLGYIHFIKSSPPCCRFVLPFTEFSLP